MNTRIVQLISHDDGEGYIKLLALCEDGTVWVRERNDWSLFYKAAWL